MHAASMTGRPSVVARLIADGAKVNDSEVVIRNGLFRFSPFGPYLVSIHFFRPFFFSQSARPQYGTPLHAASHFNHKDVVVLLLKAGADPNKIDEVRCENALVCPTCRLMWSSKRDFEVLPVRHGVSFESSLRQIFRTNFG